eukprot:3413539-Lingulodinium_polyedra.AAC.1
MVELGSRVHSAAFLSTSRRAGCARAVRAPGHRVWRSGRAQGLNVPAAARATALPPTPLGARSFRAGTSLRAEPR